jgi:hypothetical protein
MATYIKPRKVYRRMRPRQTMVDGDVDSAEAVTHTRFAETQDDGSIIIRQVLESLDSPIPTSTAAPMQWEVMQDFNNEEIPNMTPPQTPPPRKHRVRVIFD